ncbi:hypothetical protein GQ457_02G020840 [Hibiscus cannabinus]
MQIPVSILGTDTQEEYRYPRAGPNRKLWNSNVVSRLACGDIPLANPSRSIPELDVEVREEDVLIGDAGALSKIRFSDRIHDVIDAKLTHSIIIHETDFSKVLTRGLWVIYGSYLIVQPWSRNFSIASAYPSKIMVWVRLPKLPYCYNTKSLFCHIVGAFGHVVRIDYNTTKGHMRRFARLAIIIDLDNPLKSRIIIDGHRQNIEYKGLPKICFSCGKFGHTKDVCGMDAQPQGLGSSESSNSRQSEEVYGPWMQVVHRGSRSTTDDLNRLSTHVPEGSDIQGMSGVHRVPLVEKEVAARETMVFVGGCASNVVQGANKGSTILIVVSTVASKDKAILIASSLNKDKHCAVQVVIEGDKQVLRERNGRTLPNSVRGAIANRLSALSSELDQAEHRVITSPLTCTVSDPAHVIWHENTSFSQEEAFGPKSCRYFRMLVRNQKSDVFALMEPCISGSAADTFIRKLGFDCSYRVEAIGSSESSNSRQSEEVGQSSSSQFAALSSVHQGESTLSHENNLVVQSPHFRGSRSTTDDLNRLSTHVPEGSDIQGMSGVHRVPLVEKEVAARETMVFVGGCASNFVQGANKGSTILIVVSTLASKDKAILIASSLNKDKHCAVQVVIEGDKQVLRERNGRTLPNSGSKAKKRDVRGSHNPILANRLSALSSELDQAEHRVITSPLTCTVSDPAHVIWHENTSFSQEGAFGPKSCRYFRMLVRNQKSDVFALMEPCISGSAADTLFMGFDLPLMSNLVFFVTFVYANLNVTQRRTLWNPLKALEPDVGWPWAVGGKSRVWNSEMFGYIGRRKALLLARIQGLEKTLDRSNDPFLFELEKSLKMNWILFFPRRKAYDTKNLVLLGLIREIVILHIW